MTEVQREKPSETNLVEDVKRLKNKRAYLKKQLTILQNYLDEPDSINNYNKVCKQFEICEKAVDSFDVFLESIYDEDFEKIFDEFLNEKSLTDTLFGKLKTKVISQFGMSNIPSSNTDSTLRDRKVARLPPINLASFSGKYEEWLSFRDSFHSLIDSNQSLTAIEKFQYLKGAVIGEAAAVIKCLETSDTNYEQAKELLKNRYENKRVIINNHIKALFELPVLTKESHDNFRKMLDSALQHTRALKAMGRPVEGYDDFLIYLIVSKFPFITRKEWESKGNISELPTFQMLTDFLLQKCHTLETIRANENPFVTNKANRSTDSVHCHLNANLNCNICNKTDHFSNQCPILLKLSVENRISKVQEKHLCLNCLRAGHKSKECNSSKCKKCNGIHNTVLHLNDYKKNQFSRSHNVGDETSTNVNIEASSMHLSNITHSPSNVILSTCLLQINNYREVFLNARAILDSGSQINIMSRNLFKKLRLKSNNVNLTITSVSNNFIKSNLITTARIKSNYRNFAIDLKFYILDLITNYIPSMVFQQSELSMPQGIFLADPDYDKPGAIDLLIGAEIFYNLLLDGLMHIRPKGVVLKETVFGWIISGSLSLKSNKTIATSCNLNTLQELNSNISAFWEVESISNTQIRSCEERECEAHFQKTITRNSNGRFVASLPWTSNPNGLGDSLDLAKKRFLYLERKLSLNKEAKLEYDKFLREYLNLGHMREIGALEEVDTFGYYMPHHAVYKVDSLTTKTRVVFDASAKTTSGVSLNDILMTGPVIQSDLFSILIRFRLHKYIVTADVSKMYRQILINPDEVKFQRILYRFDQNQPITIFELLTLTYGTRPASFIATRCLQELALVNEDQPRIARIITEDFYMDDLITGADDLNELKVIREGVNNVLSQAGFHLLKWASNNDDLFDGLRSTTVKNLVLNNNSEPLKTLGICWAPTQDLIQYNSHLHSNGFIITKRVILANVAQIFDPLGLFGPVTILAKIIMQELWKLRIGWDEEVPQTVKDRWVEFSQHLREVGILNIPRCVILNPKSRLELHGFSDASERAFGACIYVREILLDRKVRCRLLCAKSRVAPLKTLSLPRLELCAAVLLTDLVDKVLKSTRTIFQRVVYYCDSTITLSWIRGCPSKWKVFVAHRVTEIQAKTEVKNWFHVQTQDNPADIISRGLLPLHLSNNKVWWNGPNFLLDINFSPASFYPDEIVLETRTLLLHENTDTKQFSDFIFNKFSSLTTLLRVVAFCKRFTINCRNKLEKVVGRLSLKEIDEAEISLIKMVQDEAFGHEIRLLKHSQNLSAHSPILSLNPFLDGDILRVGGRLRNASLPFSKKFPILLPKSHAFTNLIVKNEHIKALHGGTQSTLALIRLRYWPIHGKSVTQRIIRQCLTCFKNRPIKVRYKMADLPKSRLEIDRPFVKVGVDYFGPFHIKDGGRRSKRTCKVYGCVFVCMLTKAVHCEIVENLTTEAFIACFKRFISRRGLALEIFCDNATNFVGTRNELRDIYNFLENEKNAEIMSKALIQYRIKWNFNPPKAPHFGGLWEASVKSFKNLIYKIAAPANLTLIEFYTLLIEVEGILNCRPLVPLSTDPNDLDYLTPGHFLIGDHLRALPEIRLEEERINRLSHWQRIQQLQQQFWRRWSREYIQELQKRQKWSTTGTSLAVGQLVLIQEDNVPSRNWKIGRVTKVHPGQDNVVRAATIKTAFGEVKRPSVRLCVLPMNEL